MELKSKVSLATVVWIVLFCEVVLYVNPDFNVCSVSVIYNGYLIKWCCLGIKQNGFWVIIKNI